MLSERWRCHDCGAITPDAELLHAPSPFDPDDELTACPRCRGVAQFDLLCDEPGCDKVGSCGWPTPHGGYRRTCYQHATGLHDA